MGPRKCSAESLWLHPHRHLSLAPVVEDVLEAQVEPLQGEQVEVGARGVRGGGHEPRAPGRLGPRARTQGDFSSERLEKKVRERAGATNS